MEYNTNFNATAGNIYAIYEKPFIDQLEKNATALNLWPIVEASKFDQITCSNGTLGVLGGSFAGRSDKDSGYFYLSEITKAVAKNVSAMTNVYYDHQNQKVVNEKITSIFLEIKSSFLTIDASLQLIKLSIQFNLPGSTTLNPNMNSLLKNLEGLTTVSEKFIKGLKEIELGQKFYYQKYYNKEYTNPLIPEVEKIQNIGNNTLSTLTAHQKALIELATEENPIENEENTIEIRHDENYTNIYAAIAQTNPYHDHEEQESLFELFK